MAFLSDIVFDCSAPARLARFWAAALDDYEVAPYDDAELDRLRSIGIDNIEDDPTVLVQAISGSGVRVWFQRVPEPKQAKNRVHIDLRTDDPHEEIARLVNLGAHILEVQANDDVVVMHDPEGNEFCVIKP